MENKELRRQVFMIVKTFLLIIVAVLTRIRLFG